MEGGIEKKNTTLKMILDYKKYQLKKWGPYLTKQKKNKWGWNWNQNLIQWIISKKKS